MMLSLGIIFSAIPSAFVLDSFTRSRMDEKIHELVDMTSDTKRLFLDKFKERIADIKIISDPDHFLSDPAIPLEKKMSFLRNLEKNSQSYLEIAVYNMNGTKISSTRSVGIGDDASHELFFKSAVMGRTYYDKTPLHSKQLNSMVFNFAGPLYDENKKVNKVIVMGFPLNKLNDLVESEIGSSTVNITVLSSEGEVLFSNQKRELQPSTPTITKTLQEQDLSQEIIQFTDKNQFGQDIIYIASKISQDDIDLDLYLVFSIPTNVAFSQITTLTNFITLIGSVIFFISIITILFFAKTISTPLETLTKLAKEIGHGKFKQISIKNTRDEVSDLATSFNQMSKSLFESQKDNYELRRSLDEAAIVAITDKNGIITYANQKFCDISKYSEKELIGQNHRILKSGHHPPQFYQDLWNTISSGHIWQGDILNKAKDGTFYWVQTTIVPFLDENDKPEEYIAIRIDVTENYNNAQKVQESESLIKKQLNEIIETNKQKDDFASMVSHELKTPLVPILGYAEMLQDPNLLGGGLKPAQAEAVNEVITNAKRLEKLVFDVLEAQRLEMGQLKFGLEEIRIPEFMDEVFRSLIPFTSDKKIRFLNETKDMNKTITSDKNRLIEVFTNLVQNAVDFVGKDIGMITISASEMGNNILFSVGDNGPGIPIEKRNLVFAKFYQTDTSIARKHGGTGLGLVICKGIIEALGGKIWFDSVIGKGTIFYFTIPKTKY